VDLNGWPVDLEWLEEYSMVRRANLGVRLIELARTPTNPATLSPTPYPGIAPTPVDLLTFLPPPLARRGAETLDALAELLDVDLNTTERNLLIQYMDTVLPFANSSPVPAPFNGDDPAALDMKGFGLLVILVQLPDYQRF
jgi:hypothetical protein